MKTTNISNAIAALNLDAIKAKLMNEEFGEGWSQAKADAMETEYRRFLHLMQAFPNEEASPTKAVDTFWHYHILDTQKYAADCAQIFGYFLHHNPNIPEASAMEEDGSGDRMQQLYEATFGEAYIRPEAYGLGEMMVRKLAAGKKSGANLADAKSSICYALCMRQKVPAGAEASICYALCMRNKVPAGAAAAAAFA